MQSIAELRSQAEPENERPTVPAAPARDPKCARTPCWRDGLAHVSRFAVRLHRDERGVISVASLLAIFLFTVLLAMVTNVARHADDKLRMQNAADAAAQTGGVVLARGMNSVAFTNHLLCEVFALTAYMREAARGPQGSAALVPEILAEWERTGQVFETHAAGADFQKFERLGRAIRQKAPREQGVVDGWIRMSREHARLTLPVLEHILAGPGQSTSGPVPAANADPLGGYIPRFQRAVVQQGPFAAHLAANEIARRHGQRTAGQHRGRPLESRLWRTDVQIVGTANEADPFTRTLPLVDPSPMPAAPDHPYPQLPVPYADQLNGSQRQRLAQQGGTFLALARIQREDVATHYLADWIRVWMGRYFSHVGQRDGSRTAKMSNLINLWRSATCEHLHRLLDEEYPLTNLPHVIRDQPPAVVPSQSNPTTAAQVNDVLDREYTFVAVAYWPHLRETFPGLFRNLLERDGNSDALTFAQATLYLPEPRLRRPWLVPSRDFFGDINGWHVHRDNWPTHWDAFNQNWMTKLVPARSPGVLPILQANPGGSLAGFRPPRLGGITMDEINRVNMH